MPRSTISVAMATCEGGRHLDAQLRSIADQDRLPDEIVLCDDASLDDTIQVAKRFADRAPFDVRIEVNPNRLGTTANFERAVSLCAGDLIMLADQDDVWLPEKIDLLARSLDEEPSLGVVFSNGSVMDEQLSPLGYDLWQALFFDTGEQQRVRAGRGTEVFARHVVAAGTTMAFRALYRPLLMPFPELQSTHDAWVAFMVTAVSRCGLIERPLVHYRLHAANQIGLRRLGLVDQFKQARRQLEEGAFGRAAAFFELALARLDAQHDPDWRGSTYVRDIVEAKIAHSRIREGMHASLVRRLPDVLGEILRGRYWRYAYGLRSIAQDVLMR